MKRRSFLILLILIIYVIGFGKFALIVDEKARYTFQYTFGGIEFNLKVLVVLQSIYHILFGIISSFIIKPRIELNKRINFWIIAIILLVISVIPLMYYSFGRTLGNLIRRYYEIGSVSNGIFMARIIFGILIGGYLQELLNKRKLQKATVQDVT